MKINTRKEAPVREKNTTLGLLGVLGIWLTAGSALPFVNVLKEFSTPQLMVCRGLVIGLMAAIGLRGVIRRVDKYTFLIALVLPFATLCLFEGIRNWGVGPTIIVIIATPLVNLAIGLFSGRQVSRASIIGLVLMLGGVVLARWGGYFEWPGFLWSLAGTILNGILYELFSRAKASSLEKCFWASVGMMTFGFIFTLILNVGVSWSPIFEPRILALVLGFAFVGGFLYWVTNMLAFENLPTIEVSILAQGETPAVIIGAYFLLGERLTLIQWTGVAISLWGAYFIVRWLSEKPGAAKT